MNTINLDTLTINGVNGTPEVRGTCPHCNIGLDNGVMDHCPEEGYKNDERMYACMGCGGEWGPLLRKRKGVTHVGKTGKRNSTTVKAWLKRNPDATYAQARDYVLTTGRSEITLKIQARAIGYIFKK